MIVDPFTGLPMEDTPEAQSTAAQVGINELTSVGYQGRALDVLAAMPGLSTSMAWNARRGGNTLLGGGRSRTSRGAIGNHLTPRSFSRLSSIHNVDPYSGGTFSGKSYSPMNFAGVRGNDWVAKPILSRTLRAAEGARISGNASLGARVHRNLGRYGVINRDINAQLRAGGSPDIFSGGTLARMNAGARAASKLGTNVNYAANALYNASQLDPAMAKIIGTVPDATHGNIYSAIAGSGKGTVTQLMAGYMGEVRYGLTESFTSAARAGGKDALARGAAVGARHLEAVGGRQVGNIALARMAGGGSRAAMGVMAGRAAMVGSKAIPVVGQVMMAYDLTKMTMAAMGGIATTAKDASRSFKGQIDKPIMGMGYRDTTVAATSRARGVMAIQNSRLNARSVLGSEGSMLAAHFG